LIERGCPLSTDVTVRDVPNPGLEDPRCHSR
jgi:hypothetical protein